MVNNTINLARKLFCIKPSNQNYRDTQIVKDCQNEAIERNGFHKGKHFTNYVDHVKELKAQKKFDEAEALLLSLIDTIEQESKKTVWGVAPWYYEQLAIIYRKQRKYEAEVLILERYNNQKHAPGAKPQKLKDRLIKASELLNKQRIPK